MSAIIDKQEDVTQLEKGVLAIKSLIEELF